MKKLAIFITILAVCASCVRSSKSCKASHKRVKGINSIQYR